MTRCDEKSVFDSSRQPGNSYAGRLSGIALLS